MTSICMRFSNFSYMSEVANFGILQKVDDYARASGRSVMSIVPKVNKLLNEGEDLNLQSIRNRAASIANNISPEAVQDFNTKVQNWENSYKPFKMLERPLGYGSIAATTGLLGLAGYSKYKGWQVAQEKKKQAIAKA